MTRRIKLTPHGTQPLVSYENNIRQTWQRAKIQIDKLVQVLKRIGVHRTDPTRLAAIRESVSWFDRMIESVSTGKERRFPGSSVEGIGMLLQWIELYHGEKDQVMPLVGSIRKLLREVVADLEVYNRASDNRVVAGDRLDFLPLLSDGDRLISLFNKFRYQNSSWLAEPFRDVQPRADVWAYEAKKDIYSAKQALEAGNARAAKIRLGKAAEKIAKIIDGIEQAAPNVYLDRAPELRAELLQWGKRFSAFISRIQRAKNTLKV